MKNMLLVIALITVLHSASFAQSALRVEAASGFAYFTKTNSILPYWNHGWRASAGAVYARSPEVQFLVNMAFGSFAYNGGSPSYIVRREVGLVYTLDGDPSDMYEVSVGLRVFAGTAFLRPYLSFGLGILTVNNGEIRLTESSDRNPSRTFTLLARSSVARAVAIAGLGWDLQISSGIHLLVEGSITETFKGPSGYSQIGATVQYRP